MSSYLTSPLRALLLGLLLTSTRPAVAQMGKREIALPPPDGGATFTPTRQAPSLHGRDPAPIAGNDGAEYRQFRPRPDTPPRTVALYAREFDALRHLELKAGPAADTVRYAVNVDVIYSLVRTVGGRETAETGRRATRAEGTSVAWEPGVVHNAWQATRLLRLPAGAGNVAMGKGPNGDLYFYSQTNTLYRLDPRAKRLYESNLALPLRHDTNDNWLSISTWNGNLYLLNQMGNNLLELAPGRPPRNLLADALRLDSPPPFVGQPMNMGVGPDRTFYLKENNKPILWTFTEQDGRLTLAPPTTHNYSKETTGLEVVPGAPGQPPRLLLGTTGEALSEYDLATHRVINESRLITTDLAVTYAAAAEPRWPSPSAGTLRGWFSGALYVDYAQEPAVGLHFRRGGRLDSVAIAGRRLPVTWYYRQRGEQFEFGADSAFADYGRWHGGGRLAGGALTVALQSSFFAALTAGLGAARPTTWRERLLHGGRRRTHGAACTTLLTFSAGTEGFGHLAAVQMPPPPPKTPTVPAGPHDPPADSLICRSGEVLVDVHDYHLIDGDRVQFFLNERPLTGILSLRKRPYAFRFACPDPSGYLTMKTIDAAQGPCTALVTIRQGSFEKEIKLEATVARPARLKFFHRW